MIARHLTAVVRQALSDRPVVLLHGARQTGKSTLVRTLADAERPVRRYLTLDDAGVLAAAHADPAGFVAGLDGPVALDEVQTARQGTQDRDGRHGARGACRGSTRPDSATIEPNSGPCSKTSR